MIVVRLFVSSQMALAMWSKPTKAATLNVAGFIELSNKLRREMRRSDKFVF